MSAEQVQVQPRDCEYCGMADGWTIHSGGGECREYLKARIVELEAASSLAVKDAVAALHYGECDLYHSLLHSIVKRLDPTLWAQIEMDGVDGDMYYRVVWDGDRDAAKAGEE